MDMSQLTIGEIAKIEDLAGVSIDEIDQAGTPKGKLMAALVFITKRRQGEARFTFTDALNLPMPEAEAILSWLTGDDEDPKDEQPDQSPSEDSPFSPHTPD